MLRLRQLLADERGVTLTEYALALALIAVGSMVALVGIAVASNASFQDSSSGLQTYVVASPVP